MAYRPPSSRQSSSNLQQHPSGSMMTGSHSASSSQVVTPNPRSVTTGQQQPSRADQIVYRIYLKTVGVLVEGRLTHYGGRVEERKKDKWFNIVIPESDLHKSDLQIYRSISTLHASSSTTSDHNTIPPLLVAFILDTSDIPNGQALMWNRSGTRIPLDAGAIGGKGKGKEKEKVGRSGLILERWTFQAGPPDPNQPSSSQLPAHTAYRYGIIHFRALFALTRLLPAYRLYRRLRRANSGLRMGIKLWAAEGYSSSPEGLNEAWQVMEKGLVGLDTGLDQLVSVEEIAQDDPPIHHGFPPLDLFGVEYKLAVDYRPYVDFSVEDMETILSEKFVDMDEDWFTPTVARHRMEDEARAAAEVVPAARSGLATPSRRVSTPTAIPLPSSNPAPIPPRYGPVSGGSQSSRPVGSRATSGATVQGKTTGSQGADRWGALGQGLPFAGPGPVAASDQDSKDTRGPETGVSGAKVIARRLSGHSIHPFTSTSPATSVLRSTPPAGQTTSIRPGLPHSGSIGRTSSFLSQSGRSFTHAQLANMYPSSGSPPITGAMSGHQLHQGLSPTSPSSLSFSKQPVPRTVSGRSTYQTPPGSSPFIPGSLERDYTGPSPTGQTPHLIKRYSSSLSQRPARSPAPGSQGSPGEVPSLPGSVGGTMGGLLRRTSTRVSTESGLRNSLDSGSRPAITVPDDDDIQAFLKTLDALPQPPSLAAQAAHSSRAYLPSTSSSLSVPSVPPSPSGAALQGSGGSPGQSGPIPNRTPMTRAQVDDALRRMTGSFTQNTRTFEASVSASASASASLSPSVSASQNELRGPQIVSRDTSTAASGSTNVSGQPSPSPVSPASATPAVGLLTASRPGSVMGIGHGLSSRRAAPVSIPRRPSAGQAGPHSGGTSLGRSASVKNSSPLSGAPIGAGQSSSMLPPDESGTATGQEDPNVIASKAPETTPQAYRIPPLHPSPRTLKATARSLPGAATALSAEDVPTPLYSVDASNESQYQSQRQREVYPGLGLAIYPHVYPAAPGRSSRGPSSVQSTASTPGLGVLSPESTGAAAAVPMATSASESNPINPNSATRSGVSRRGPVLLRGGFEGRQSYSSGANGGGNGVGRSGMVSPGTTTPSHSPVREYGRLITLSSLSAGAGGVGGSAATGSSATATQGYTSASGGGRVLGGNSWRRYKSASGIGSSAPAQVQAQDGVKKERDRLNSLPGGSSSGGGGGESVTQPIADGGEGTRPGTLAGSSDGE